MKRLVLLVLVFLIAVIFITRKSGTERGEVTNFIAEYTPQELWKRQLEEKRKKRASGYSKMDQPDMYQMFHREIRTRAGEKGPDYPVNHRIEALKNLRNNISSFRTSSNGVVEYVSRGPANVPGRTRGLLNLPGDPNDETWLAGSAGGGIWRTSNGGASWTLLTPDFPTLAVSTLAMSEVDDEIIYAGTGEYIASSGTAIQGQGIFKSTDGGNTWVQLPSTVNTADFINITRIIVDPNDPNIVLACSAPNNWRFRPEDFISTIMKSTDGGNSWNRVFIVDSDDIAGGLATGAIEQLIYTPGNFDVMYAAMHGFGAFKSTDAGETWLPSNTGMAAFGRVELAVSPVNTSRLFASAEGALSGADSDSDLYISEDAGATWSYLRTEFNGLPVDFLGGQGWYDNTIACDPYDQDVVYAGGVSLFRFEVSNETRNSYSISTENLDFLTLINFGADYAGGTLEANEFAGEFSIEVRFGPGRSQLAHRYTVPENATSGVPPDQYFYQDYVSVPFQVWDVTNNRQLMVGFRDQDRNGIFNLRLSDTDNGEATQQSREYLYIADIPYQANSDPDMALTGGHEYRNAFFFWPVLSQGSTWDPANLPTSNLSINYNGQELAGANTVVVADVYGEFDGNNQFLANGDVHPDQHNMIMLPVDESSQTYKILLSNDGGVFISDPSARPGVASGSWNFTGNGYVTTQFYGAQKMPGAERFLGGTQDNGTWFSPQNIDASEATNYQFAIGGDGFEVLWHALDPQKFIGGSQFNRFRRTLNGGITFSNATQGIVGDNPFISKLASSDALPERIFTVSSEGVFRSDNFGESWELTPVNSNWIVNNFVTFLDVEVSRANANIIWAGSGMDNNRRLHYSTDGGRSFNEASNFNVPMGTLTKLGSHPTQPNTAYALFSFAKGPKVLRTTDLGQTWEDISGFGTGEESTTGFPDVAVYTIYVRPDNPDIIWVGTEIGIVQSLDNGATWNLLDEFPNASVWQLSGRDSLITIATHGRGIWTAKVEALQQSFERPQLVDAARMPNGNAIIVLDNPVDYDSASFIVNNQFAGSIASLSQGLDTIVVNDIELQILQMTMIGYEGNSPVANNFSISILPDREPISEFFAVFEDNEPTISTNAFTAQQVNPSGANASLHTPHDYPNNANLIFRFSAPVVVSSTNPFINYEDIAIVEPGDNDYVVVEGTLDGLNWISLTDRYDASFNSEWLEIYNSGGVPDLDNFVNHVVDLSETFDAGDTIFIRYRLHSDDQNTGWGWAVDDIFVQTEVTSITADLKSNISIYPNPAKNILTIESNEETIGRIDILDSEGKRIRMINNIRTRQQLDVSGFNNGIYMVLIYKGDGQREVRKIVVQH